MYFEKDCLSYRRQNTRLKCVSMYQDNKDCVNVSGKIPPASTCPWRVLCAFQAGFSRQNLVALVMHMQMKRFLNLVQIE